MATIGITATAKRLNCPPWRVKQLVQRGELVATRDDANRRRFDTAAVDALAAQRAVPQLHAAAAVAPGGGVINLLLKLAVFRAGLTQRAVARLAGVPEKRFSAIVQQTQTPRAAERARIAHVVNVDERDLWPALVDTPSPEPRATTSAA